QNFGETLNDGENSAGICSGSAIAQLSDSKLRHQRRVARQNAEFSFRARHHHLDDALAQELPLWRDDDQLDGIGKHLRYDALAFIFSAFARASSIVPTM